MNYKLISLYHLNNMQLRILTITKLTKKRKPLGV
nr:MAG TPA: hypothetical protein [Caudoviricetes sp.]